MASKYWWEEDEQQSDKQTTTQSNTQTGKKYWWEEDAKQSSGKSFWWDDGTLTTTIGNDITNRVNNWLKNHSTYISDYQKRYSGRKGSYEDAYVSDSADWLTSVSQRTDEYDAQRQEILSYIDQNKDYLDADWVEKIRNTLAKGRDAQFKIRDAAKKDNEWWAKFTPNEEQTAAGYTAEQLYNQWQTESKQYAEDQVYDVEAGMVELEELKKERDAYLAEQEEKRKKAQEDESFWDSLGRWLGNTPDTTIPLAGANEPISSERHTNEYDKRIAELEERIKRSKYVQGYEGYMANMDAEDYAANSQYDSTRTEVAMDDARWGFGNTMYDESKLFGDFLYDYINGNQDALDVATVNNTATDAYFLGFDKGFLQTLTDDEIGVYNSLYKLDKEQGTEKATEFLRFIESDLKGRKRAQEQAFWAGYAKESPVGSSVFSTLISPLKGISYLGQAADMLDDGKMDENAGYNRFSYIPSTIRSQVSTTIENGNWGKVGSFAYNTGMSMADFLFTTAVSGGNQSLSLAIMGSGAAADATIAAKERGLDDGQAFTLGTIAGIAEVAMERISLGAWLEGDMTEGALRYVLKNALTEGGEEAGTSAINLLADVMISGDKSEWNVAMQAYIDQGKSPQEAFGLVAAEQAAQIGLDALGGMLSGAAIGSGTYAGTSAVAGFQYGDTAKNKVEAQKLVAEGLELNPESKYVQNAQSKLEKGKNLTGMQVRNILAANQEQITSKDLKKIQTAAEKRLTDLGQTENVAEVAEIATKWATGQEISRAEKKLLTHSEYGSRVANELLPDNIASGDYSTEWAEEIGTKQVNATAYNLKSILEKMATVEDPNSYKSLESRVDTETPAKVSDTGKAVIRATGEEIDLTSPTFKQITEDGVVLDVNGKPVRSNEIDYDSEDQGLAINAIGKIEHITPAVASSLYAKLDMTKPVMKQLNGMDEAFTYGYYNYSEADLEAGTFTGDLTQEQKNDAYKLGQYVRKNDTDAKADAFKQMRTAADAVAEKNATEGKAATGAKNLTLTYNKGNGEVVSIDEAKLNDQQSGGVEWAKILHKMGLGTRVEFFESYESETMTVKDKKTGKVKKARVFINDAGVEQIAYSGVYRKRDGTIRIDLNAYNGRGFTLNALAHELTHFIQQWSDKKYKVLVDFLMKEYEKTDMTMHERVLREQKRLENIRGEEVSYDEAYDEVVANAMNKMFDDGKMAEKLAKLKEQDKNLAQKLWEGFKEILAKFIGIYEKEGLFQDADVLVEMKETFEQLQNMFAEALVEASDNYQASLTVSESQSITEAGIGFDEDTKSVYSLHFSTAYKDEIQVGKKTFDTEAIAKIVAKGTGRSIEDARKWVQSEMTIANIVMANPEFLDFEADSRYEAIKKNSDYPQGTVDLSNLCPKREEFTTMFDMLQKKYPNKLFTAQDVAEMRKILSDNDITVACGACFVEDRRQLLGEIADTYINMWKEAVDSGKPLQKTNAAGVKSDLLVTKALAKQYGLTAGTKIMATDTYIPNQYDLTTYEGFKLLEKNHPTIAMGFNRYNNSRGQQSARLIEGRAEYKRQILGWSDAKVRSVNNNGGLRIFSFSDFEVVHLLDLVQVIIDCAAKGVKIQGYTKIPAFAKLVRDTGIKLNRSLIPKGDYGYHMENGKVVLDYDTTEGIDINDKNFIDESANPNVGNIVIGINPTQIGAAMLEPFIDYIIPFHSNKAKEILKKLGTGEWVNYKESQHEKDISTGTSSKHNVNIYTEVLGKYNPTNKVEFVEAFLKECKRQGKIPRYAEFLNVDANGDYAYREGYHKLLVDFKMFDADGNILPQGNITPKLNEGFMKELLNAEIDKKQNYEFPQEVYDAIDKKFGEQEDGDRFSLHDPIEATNDLMAFHNITEKLLWDALKQKGLVMPSFAVTNKGLNEFGEISLLFDKSVIDPAINKDNKLYGSDAWTPMQTSLKMNAKFDTDKTVRAVNTMKNRIGSKYVSELLNITPKQFKETIIKADGNIYEAYAHNIGVQSAYAMEKGIISQIPTNKDGTVNKEMLQKQLEKTLDTDNGWRQYRRWLNNISDTVITSYDQATNEDILRHMKAQPATAKTFKLSETGELIVPAKEYSSIKELRRNKNRLSENAEEATKAVAAEFMEFAKKIGDTQQVVEAINAGFEGRYNIADIMKAFRTKGIEISSKEAGELQSLYKKAVELPTQYFEAKPGGTVGIEKIHTAVVPKNTSTELRQALEELGINVLEYNGTKDSRVEAMNSVKELRFSSQETDADAAPEINAKDVVDSGNGVLAVNISSKKSGLNRYKKSKWASVISKQIRATLQGHAIYAADGDIIRITDRAPGEVSYGTDSNKLFAEAKKTGDYSEFNKKMITADHAMTIIALSTYDSWSANTEDPTDMFKRDGLNHRKVNLVIDGEPYTAVVLTCLNIDPDQTEDYGEKFYDIVSIEKQAKHSAMSGTFSTKATPHKIRFADGSPDMLTIAQKERIVNRKNATYSTGDAGTKTAMAEAFSRAKELKSSQETDADNAPIFYSKMGKVIKGMKQEKFGASSVISMLRDPKRGVKAEEIRWSGIQAFLDGKKSVTKQELLDFINSSMLQIEEESRTDNKVRTEYIQAWKNFVDQDLDEREILDGLNNLDEMESYLESLVEDEDLDRYYADYILRLAHEVANSKDLPTKWDQYKLDGGSNYRELVFKMPGSTFSNAAMRTHWGDGTTGVLAHARLQDLNTFIGKMLFIEEIQSDWHNEGHKVGYIDESKRLTVKNTEMRHEGEWYNLYHNGKDLHQGVTETWLKDRFRNGITEDEIHEGLVDEYNRVAVDKQSVPDAPFKDNYHEYVLKRLLRMAAEEGYDSIGWTTADIQSDRWSAEYAEGYRIEYDQDIPKFLKKYGKQWDSTVGKTVLDNGTEVWSMAITDSMKDSVLKEGQEMYSEHDTDYSNRSLLANAFEGITNGSEEYKLIQEYKGHIAELNSLENKLSEFNREIRKIRFGSDGQYDAEKLRRLETEAKKIAEAINRHDRKLVSLEASAPLRRLIERERKKEAQKTKAHVKEIQQNKKVRAEQTELRHKIRKTIRDLDKILNRGNKKQNVKEDMKGFVSKALELADYLFTDHISNDDLIRKGITVRMTQREAALVKETEDILSKLYDNADSLTDEEFTRLDAKRKANEDKLRDLLTAQRNERLNTPVYNLFNDLVTEYASLKNSKQEAVKGAYDPKVEEFLQSYLGENADGTDSDRKTHLQNMRVADMTTEELWKLHNAYTMVLHSVRQANSLFVKGKTESIEQMAGRIMSDFSKRKAPDGKVATVIRNLSNKMGWDYEKLYYALDRIGSESFTELVMNLADAENTVMQDIMEAVAFRDEIVKKYGFNNWAVNKEIDREFMDTTGKKFKMTLGQLMSLYAYSRREGAWDHIEYGGFVFGEAALTNPKPADSYKLSKAQCEAITNTLTKEQKSYVEDMQKFLSETMGAKGNEVSMLLYGINMFGEKNYFPIHIAGQFKAQANESQAKAAAGFSSMTNAGFTHAQNPNAKAPFVLEGFNEIWADHVNEMSRYHGTVPALEDMRRVMNRSSYSEAEAESMAIKQLMENSFGKDAVEYFDNLYREANSGAITDKLQKKSKKLLSLFRKNSVAYSLSVIIQQPSAMARAYAMIDKKYFGFKGVGALTSGVAKAVSSKWNPAYANAYNEMMKYAPGVTMAKEIGGFDTHTGSSIREYLLDTGKSFKQSMKTENLLGKGKAVLDLVDDNAIANLPNVADKIAWIEIWNACKRETVAKHKDLATNSEEFMQAVGKRFTEVIRATQVYDSIFAKSPMLKSKNLAVQYLVSFMNEPNTTANMAEKAVRDATKGDWKGGLRVAGAVTYSIIFNNVLKAIVYAMRDDDEDETYIEKYLAAVAGGMIDDFLPMNYIPIVRDVWSKARGFDVERPDMAIITDAIDAWQSLAKAKGKDTEGMTEAEIAELDEKVTDASWKLVGSLAAFFGIPVKNIYREIDGIIDHARIASANAGMTTASGIWDKVKEEIIDSIPFMSAKEAKTDKLYDAIIGGDTKYLERMKGTYKTEDAYQSAVRKALRENDSRIKEAAQARYEGNSDEYKRIFREIQGEGKFSFDDIMSAINTELSKLEPDNVTSDYTATGYVEAIVMGNMSGAEAMKEDIIATKVANGKTQAEAEKEFVSSVATSVGKAYSSGLLDEAGAKNMLMEYAGKDEDEAASKVSYWAFCEDNPKYDYFNESNVKDYREFAEPENISLEVFAQFVNGTKGLADIKDEWGDVEVSKREQVLEVINSLDLTWQQKDALYLAAGYAESKIWDVPW